MLLSYCILPWNTVFSLIIHSVHIISRLCFVRYTVQWCQQCKNEHFQHLIKRKTEWNCILQAGKSRETSSVHEGQSLLHETLAASPWSALTLQLNTRRRVCVPSRPLSISIRFINRLCLQTAKTRIQHTWHTPMLAWLSRHTLYLCLSRMTHWSKRTLDSEDGSAICCVSGSVRRLN